MVSRSHRVSVIDDDSVVEAPAKKGKRPPDPLSVQRNVPREMVNALTNPGNPHLRYMVWEVRKLPKGTQTARLLRYMEDKGWRRTTVGGRDVFYHGRSFKLIEPEVGAATLDDLYGNFRPRGTDDVADARELDKSLLKLWGVDYASDPVAADVDPSPVVARTPSNEFFRFITSRQNVEAAEKVADLFYQHTGIVMEPLAATLPRGKPKDRRDVTRTDLPYGVRPDDIVVTAEAGRLYVVRARDFGEGVHHGSTSLIGQGRVRVTSKGPDIKMRRSGGVGDDWEELRKRYGMDRASKRQAGPSQMVRTRVPGGGEYIVPSAWLDKGPVVDTGPDVDLPAVRVQGDGVLTRAVSLARREGRDHIYLVGEDDERISVTPVPLQYSRGGTVDERTRAASTVKRTGGLPVRPGRWSTDDLGRWLRMFERDTGSRL